VVVRRMEEAEPGRAARVVEYLQHADPPRVATSEQLRRPQSHSFHHISFGPQGRAQRPPSTANRGGRVWIISLSSSTNSTHLWFTSLSSPSSMLQFHRARPSAVRHQIEGG